MDKLTQRVLDNPEFQKMAHQKSVLGWSFSILIFSIYVVYILYIGLSPESFGVPVGTGSITTWGIYIGLFVILFAIAITGIYVHKANGVFEETTQRVIRVVQEQNHE
ncbi:MAG: DUF485 domain-containing protein [Advenella sp.]|nr:DUF485 domain-containing protein [Advenella mandrilli]MDY0273186.1 DUF485 domain-containing protein [Advenella sp.]